MLLISLIKISIMGAKVNERRPHRWPSMRKAFYNRKEAPPKSQQPPPSDSPGERIFFPNTMIRAFSPHRVILVVLILLTLVFFSITGVLYLEEAIRVSGSTNIQSIAMLLVSVYEGRTEEKVIVTSGGSRNTLERSACERATASWNSLLLFYLYTLAGRVDEAQGALQEVVFWCFRMAEEKSLQDLRTDF